VGAVAVAAAEAQARAAAKKEQKDLNFFRFARREQQLNGEDLCTNPSLPTDSCFFFLPLYVIHQDCVVSVLVCMHACSPPPLSPLLLSLTNC
jgi:hypothetical protein